MKLVYFIPLQTFPILELPTGDLVQCNIYLTQLSCIANLLKREVNYWNYKTHVCVVFCREYEDARENLV